MKVWLVSLNMTLGIVIPLALQLSDRKRLSAAQREWVWNFASWGAALYNFGPISLVAWGYVTRSPSYWWGLLNGVVMAEVAIAAQALINEIVGRALSLGPKALADTREGFLGMGFLMVALAVLIGAGRSIHDAIRGRRPLPRRP